MLCQRVEDSPHPYTAPKYGRKVQDALQAPETVEITPDENKFLEQVLGTFLYYGQAVDSTMLMAINSIAVRKKYGMRETMEAIVQLLNYAASHQDAEITYRASNMVLKIHTDASYLSKYGARS